MKFVKWYGYFWYKFGYVALDHGYTTSGARMGAIQNTADPTDTTIYDGVVDGKGHCLHFKSPTHKGTFNSGTGQQDNVYLNYRYYTKLIGGRMKIMKLYHVKFYEENVLVQDIPGDPLAPKRWEDL
jgi:hypothetical protein